MRATLIAGAVLAAVAGPVTAAAADALGPGSGPVGAGGQVKPAEPGYPLPTAGTKARKLPAAPKPLRPADKRPGPESRPNGPDPQIIGGGQAKVGEYPYFVSLQFSSGSTGDAFCGGSLLSTTKVLTAAHCVDWIAPADLQVTIGGTTLVGTDVGVVRNVSAIAVNPAYNSATAENDVAIVTLATPVTRADAGAQWLRLAQGNELGLVDPGDTSTVIGHGAIAEGGPGSNQLLEVAVPIQSDATMTTAYGSSFYPATMVGAGPLGGGLDSCQGDSGGPLAITSPAQDILIGDVSWGWGCARPNLPGVYGELYQGAMATWVDSQVGRPGNDRFGSATALAGNAGSAFGSNENATVDPGENSAETSVWYSWTPTASGNAQIAVNQHGFDSEVAVYTGSAVSGLSLVARNDDANLTLQSEVEFTAVAGTTYRIQVDGFAFDYGTFWLSYGVNRPANDDFAAAAALTGSVSLPFGATNAQATGEAGEPSPIFGSANSSLWYSWTAPGSGIARMTTYGSAFDTTLAAYTGSALGTLAQLGANDDANGTLQSLLSFSVTSGTVYRIQVSGFGGQRGNLVLQYALNPEPNDLFANAQVISGSAGAVSGSNLQAIAEPGEPNFGNLPDTSVWYRWVAPASGTYRFSTAGSTFDTVLASATGSVLTALTLVAFNDDAIGLQSQIEFTATAGTTYQIWVDGWGGNRGSIQLAWTQL